MKILKNEKIFKITSSLILMLALVLGCIKPNNANNLINDDDTRTASDEVVNLYVTYNSHIQDFGWEDDFSKINGETSGTTGKNKKVEAIKIKLLNAPDGIGITYQSYLQDKEWQKWVTDGEMTGTTGQNRKLEAIKIKLTGTEEYSVEYRTHVQDMGWMDWVKDGEVSGIVGKKLKVEAIEIRIVPKTMTVIYQSHVQDMGWQQFVNNGETSGTVGKGLKVEAVKIELKNTDIKIKYQTHVQDLGWEKSWKTNGEESGTTGQNKKVEAIRIKLNDIDNYSVMYRAYINGIGWQNWVKDGEISGTTGQNRKLEAIQIKIVKKEASTEFSIRYTTHVQDIGWTDYEKDGATSGVIDEGKKIEAIKIIGKNIPENVAIKYQSHIQDLGWENDWVTEGEQSGTTGKNKKIEAIKIKLEGSEEYSIEYRTYVNGKGWQKWANDGEISGTTGQNRKIEAIEIKIVPKIEDRIQISMDTKLPANVSQSEYTIKGWLMTNIEDVKIQVLVDDELIDTVITREERTDVLEAIKGYGGQEKNPNPGFQIKLNFKDISLGRKKIKFQFVDKKGNVLLEEVMNTTVKKVIEQSTGTYGKTGLRIAGKGGDTLKYLKFGNGENVFFATFAIHGYEDLWDKDGYELINIAEKFYNRLVSDQDYDIADKWTIYVFPGVNLDGLSNGYTNNGPGRTTLYSQAPNNKGIDLNRCWQIGNSYTEYRDNRNYNGTTGFQAYESQSLREFLLNNKSKNGQTILVDLHGWTQQLIGDSGICSYYERQFPENDKSAIGRYGTGYLINWARTYLGSNGKAARTALIELPNQGVNGSQSVVNKNFANRYINATIEMLKNM